MSGFLTIGSTDTNEPEVMVSLAGEGVLDPLSVQPANGWSSEGHMGGPFTPAATVYAVVNSSTQGIAWTALWNAGWLNISPASGVAPALGVSTVSVSLTSAADALAVGMYTDTIVFSNNLTGITTERSVRLEAYQTPEVTVTPAHFVVTNVAGGTTARTLTVGNAAGADAPLTCRIGSRHSGFTPAQTTATLSSPPADRDFTDILARVPHATDRILVRFRPRARGAARTAALSRFDRARIDREVGIVPGLCRVRFEQTQDVANVLAELNADPDVLYAEPVYEVRINDTFPDDARFNELWGMHNTGQNGGTPDADIDAPAAWDIAQGSREIIVAVIDTGVDYTHEDIAANIWTNAGETPGNGRDDDGNGFIDDIHGYDFYNNDANPMDDHNHGTHCSGTIGGVGNNAKGVAGVCWQVQIMALKFLGASGSGNTDDAVFAVDYATRMGARVMNNSWGGGGFSQALKDAIDAAAESNVVFCAAAGNNSRNTDSTAYFPSCYESPNVISVMATDNKDSQASFSNWGLETVDIAAPGVNVLSCIRNNGYATMNGTSMATPHTAGACALLLSVNPDLTVADVKAALFQSVDYIPAVTNKCQSHGRLNVARALTKVDAPWMSIMPPALSNIAAGASAPATVTFLAGTRDPGTYEGSVVIGSNDRFTPATNVPATMVVLPTALTLTPASGLACSGVILGEFAPTVKEYVLSNRTASATDWSAVFEGAWLDVSPAAGTLPGGAAQVVTVRVTNTARTMQPGAYADTVVFSNRVSGAVQQRTMTLDVEGLLICSFDMNSDPGWATEGKWGYGRPMGWAGDPGIGFGGWNCYGYNLRGAYTNDIPRYYLTTSPLDFRGYSDVSLAFHRWLTVEDAQYDHAGIEGSADGVSWTSVWEHTGPTVSDGTWLRHAYPLGQWADMQPAARVRWAMGTTDDLLTFGGWNIDEVEFYGMPVDPPLVEITNAPTVFYNDDPIVPFAGRNNANVVGMMWWSNVTTRAAGVFAADTEWSVTNIPLAFGDNSIVIGGTNVWGITCIDAVSVQRIDTLLPVIDADALLFPAPGNEIMVDQPTNIVWDPGLVHDNAGCDNLMITRLSIVSSSAWEQTALVTTNGWVRRGSWTWLPTGMEGSNTRYAVRLEVRDAAGNSTNRVFSDSLFNVVPEPAAAVAAVCALLWAARRGDR